MKDQSQIEAMRAAVRGDIERARKRQQTSPVLPPEPEPQRDAEEKRQRKLAAFFRRR
jgi:hypothetical protein